jgi:hypothetical protein
MSRTPGPAANRTHDLQSVRRCSQCPRHLHPNNKTSDLCKGCALKARWRSNGRSLLSAIWEGREKASQP